MIENREIAMAGIQRELPRSTEEAEPDQRSPAVEQQKAYELTMEERPEKGAPRTAVVLSSILLGLSLVGLIVGGYYKKKKIDTL